MFRVAFKDLMARKRRLVTTGLAVMLGIAFLTGTQVLSTVLKDSIDSLMSDIYDGYDAVVRSPKVQDLGFGQELRAAVDAEAVDRVADVADVRVAEGVIEAVAVQLIGSDGKVVGSDFGPPTIVVNLLSDDLDAARIVDGREPESDDEMVMDFSTAEQSGFDIGEQVPILGPEGREEFTLVGTAGIGEDGGRTSGARVLGFTTPVAQRLAQIPGEFTYVAAAAVEGVSEDELVARIAEAVPELQVVTGETFTRESSDSIAQFVDILSIFVSVFGYVALFVACFIIYNTFSILVAQRTRETALLRAVGAKRRQVLLATLAEAAIVGLIASLAGLVGGALLATLLKTAVSQVFSVEPGIPAVPASAIILAFMVGLVVTVASAVIPALRSSKVPPVAAMSEVAIDHSGVSRSRVVWGTAFTVVGIALFALGLTDTGPNPLLEFGIGAALILIAVAVVLAPLIAAPISRALARPFGSRSITARLAGENAARNPRRTAATAAALTIGVTLVTLIAIVASSVRTSVDSAVKELVQADLVVATSSFSFGAGIPTGTTEQVAELDHVEVASAVRFAPVRLLDDFGKARAAEDDTPAAELPAGAVDDAPDGQDDFALGIDPATFFTIANAGEMDGSPDDLEAGTLAVLARTAEERGWEIGDRIPLYFAQTGIQELEVVLTFEKDVGQGISYLMPTETIASNSLPTFNYDFAIYIQTTDDATPDQTAELRDELDAMFDDSPTIEVQDLQEYADAQTAPLDTFLAIVYGLLGLAVIIALIGIANTLSLSVLERTRELGLLRAVGMSRKQLRQTIVRESVIIAVLGTVIGLVIGIVFSIALSVVIAADEPDLFRFHLPVRDLVIITVVAALAGVLAALLPAWRASRLDVLDAVSSV